MSSAPEPRSPAGRWRFAFARRPSSAVLLGGLIGSAARVGVAGVIGDESAFPYPALVVNLIGSFLLGLYLARRQRAVTGESSVPFWAIGVLGSFTTFSAFSLDVVQLLDSGRLIAAAGYVAVSVVGGIALALVGERLGAVVS